MMESLVSTAWLAGALDDVDVRVVDASYTSTIPGTVPRDPHDGYRAGHIPGALFLDLDTLKDTVNPLPSMLPSGDAFAERMRSLGLGAATRIILYDDGPHHTSCRAWWVMRMFGIADVALLDGGIAKWRREGRSIEAGEVTPRPGGFSPSQARSGVRSLAEMRANLDSRAERVVDARSTARFTGDEPDPRPGAASGHIPGSANIPYDRFFADDGTWKRGAELTAVFDAAGVAFDRPLVATCGSGITAAVIAFAAHLLGQDAAIYDGSWSEWGSDPSTPKATGL